MGYKWVNVSALFYIYNNLGNVAIGLTEYMQAIHYFKKSIDLAVMSLLQESDKLARKENQFQIEERHLANASKSLFNPRGTLEYVSTSSIVMKSFISTICSDESVCSSISKAVLE